MNIRKTKDNFNKDRRPRCFNCNIYEHMVKECKKQKKEQDTRKCYKCNKVEHITKDCRMGQKKTNIHNSQNQYIIPKEQQRKRVKHVNQYQDIKQERIMATGISRFRIYLHRN